MRGTIGRMLPALHLTWYHDTSYQWQAAASYMCTARRQTANVTRRVSTGYRLSDCDLSTAHRGGEQLSQNRSSRVHRRVSTGHRAGRLGGRKEKNFGNKPQIERVS